jgi:hypothetical protein
VHARTRPHTRPRTQHAGKRWAHREAPEAPGAPGSAGLMVGGCGERAEGAASASHPHPSKFCTRVVLRLLALRHRRTKTHSLPNTQYPTPNTQHPTPNTQHRPLPPPSPRTAEPAAAIATAPPQPRASEAAAAAAAMAPSSSASELTASNAHSEALQRRVAVLEAQLRSAVQTPALPVRSMHISTSAAHQHAHQHISSTSACTSARTCT